MLKGPNVNVVITILLESIYEKIYMYESISVIRYATYCNQTFSFITMFVNERIRDHFKLTVYLFIPSSTSKGHVWTFAVKYRPRLMFSLNA